MAYFFDTGTEIIVSESRQFHKVWLGLFFIVEIVSIWKWFATTHLAFWEGFKELILAVVPLINITYSWDWIWAGHFWMMYVAPVIGFIFYILVFRNTWDYFEAKKYEEIKLKYVIARNPIISSLVKVIVFPILLVVPFFLFFYNDDDKRIFLYNLRENEE